MKPLSVEDGLWRAIQLLREVRMQEFINETAWDSRECRKWIKATDKLLDYFGGIR